MMSILNKFIQSKFYCLMVGCIILICIFWRKTDTLEYSRRKILYPSWQKLQQSERIPFKWDAKTSFVAQEPTKNILYVKTHKTGSTTWKTVFQSYSEKYNLNLCMDAKDRYHLNWPSQILVVDVIRKFDEKCDMIADEMIYNKEIINKLMNPNPFFITSVRHPVQHFFSLYKMVDIHQAVIEMTGIPSLTKWQEIEIFIKNYRLVQNYYIVQKPFQPKLASLVQRNLQLTSLDQNINKGIEGNLSNEKLKEIKSVFNQIDHFIVAEYSAETLLILTRKLNCEMEDLFYTQQNVLRSTAEKNEFVPEVTQKLILEFNSADFQLYQLALKKMFQEISNYQNFEEDLKLFNAGLNNVTAYCQSKTKKVKMNFICGTNYNQQFTETSARLKRKLKTSLEKTMKLALKNSTILSNFN